MDWIGLDYENLWLIQVEKISIWHVLDWFINRAVLVCLICKIDVEDCGKVLINVIYTDYSLEPLNFIKVYKILLFLWDIILILFDGFKLCPSDNVFSYLPHIILFTKGSQFPV